MTVRLDDAEADEWSPYWISQASAVIDPWASTAACLGGDAGDVVNGLLNDAGITLHAQPASMSSVRNTSSFGRVALHPHPERIVTLPTISGPNVRGIPGDATHRLLPIDGYCRVCGTDGRVFAAGDATDLPVKQGGVGAQQADAAAGVARLAGLAEHSKILHRVIRGTLVTCGKPLLSAHLLAGEGWQAEIYEQPPWPLDDKVIAEELGRYRRGDPGCSSGTSANCLTEPEHARHRGVARVGQQRMALACPRRAFRCDHDTMRQIDVQAAPLEMFGALLTRDRSERFTATATRARALLAGRIVWNVSATVHGGGVAEMLQALLAYARGAGVDARWLVVDPDAAFFAITKRVHKALHGAVQAGAELGAVEHEHYARVLARNLSSLRKQVRPGDVVLLHDPQTAGLVEGVRETGAHVIWRCHIGRDEPNAATVRGWEFLRGYLDEAAAFVFSRERYAPEWLPRERLRVIPPSIDPFSSKNRDLTDGDVGRVLRRVGLVAGVDIAEVAFTRRDGTPGVVRRHENCCRIHSHVGPTRPWLSRSAAGAGSKTWPACWPRSAPTWERRGRMRI
jgi:hypothetical protein